MVSEIEKLKKDKEIKAVVFRINSGGGSAYASEQIWKAITDLKEENQWSFPWETWLLQEVITLPAMPIRLWLNPPHSQAPSEYSVPSQIWKVPSKNRHQHRRGEDP